MSSVLITSDEYDYFCAMQWQPIETAPMDGTEVMVRYILTPLSSTHQEAYFHDEANDGNNEWVMSWSGDAMESGRVTHWMPRAKEPE